MCSPYTENALQNKVIKTLLGLFDLCLAMYEMCLMYSQMRPDISLGTICASPLPIHNHSCSQKSV